MKGYLELRQTFDSVVLSLTMDSRMRRCVAGQLGNDTYKRYQTCSLQVRTSEGLPNGIPGLIVI